LETIGSLQSYIVRKDRLFSFRNVGRYPPDEGGWTQAWRRFAELVGPDLEAQGRRQLQAWTEEPKNAQRERECVAALDAETQLLLPVRLLGGYGFSEGMNTGTAYDLRFTSSRMLLTRPGSSVVVHESPLEELVTIEVEGPGVVREGGGFFGGGFGAKAAVEGMVVAGILNALTTKKEIQTVVRIASNSFELYLSNETVTPSSLRIQLSPVMAAMAAKPVLPSVETPVRQPADSVDRLIKLGEMRDRGLLTDEEFGAAKKRLLDDGN
jgi:hypothetical protein